MTRPVYTPRTTYPRLLCLNSDHTAIFNRTNSTSQWKNQWDGEVLPSANTYSSKTDADLADDSSLDAKFLTLGLAGWIDGVTGYHSKLRSAGLHLLNNSGLWESSSSGGFVPDRREQVIALAHGYEFLRAGGAGVSFSDADRKTWGEKLIQMCSAGWSTGERIDGHSGGNQMAQLAAGLVLHGESGGSGATAYNHTAAATTIINNALNFWYGQNAGDDSRMESERFFMGDGGSGIGPWYSVLRHFHVFRMLYMLRTACSAITLEGDPYDPLVDEGFVQKVGEFWIRYWGMQGDNDYLIQDDTYHSGGDPYFDPQVRFTCNVLIKFGGPWRRLIREFRDRMDAIGHTSPLNVSNYDFAQDVIMWDPADAANAPQTPAQAAIPRHRLFDPPGEFVYASSLNPVDAVDVHFTAREFDYAGHQGLCAGSLAISIGDERLVCRTGIYHTSPMDNPADFGGLHHRAYYQQSISHSGVPLIHQPGLVHKNKNLAGSRVDFPSGLGGQMFKEFVSGGSTIYDPDSSRNLRFDGGGMAWRRSGRDSAGTGKLRFVTPPVPGSHYHLHVDYTEAYRKRHTDPLNRVVLCETQLLIVEGANVGARPIVLRLDKITSANASFQKRQHWNGHGPMNRTTVNAGTPQQHYRVSWNGFKGKGRIVIDTFGYQDFTTALVGADAPNDLSSVLANQFSYGGTDYHPGIVPSARNKPNFGRWRYEISPSAPALTDFYFTVFFPLLVGESPPSKTWLNETDWFGIDLDGFQIRLGKNTPAAIVGDPGGGGGPGPAPPPNAPFLNSASPGPGAGEITMVWTPVPSGAVEYQPKYRLKV